MTITVIDLVTGECRNLAQDAPVLTPPLALQRAQASLDRAAFCTALLAQGVIAPEEAVEAARGGWPPAFAAALATAGDGDGDLTAQIAWAAQSGRIGRTDPLVLALLAWHAADRGLTPGAAEAVGDAVFGLSPGADCAPEPAAPQSV